jgi:hypothetical protein
MGIVPQSTSGRKKKRDRGIGRFFTHHFPLPRDSS